MRRHGERTARRYRSLIAAATVLLVLGGCSDDADETPTEETTSTTPTTSASPSAEPGPSPDEDPTATPDAAPKPTELDIEVVSPGRDLSMLVARTAGTGSKSRSGKIIVAERGCVHMTRRDARPILLVLPPGAELDAQRRPTLVVDGARFPVGTPVTVRGDTVALDADQASAARPCVARGKVFRVAKIS